MKKIILVGLVSFIFTSCIKELESDTIPMQITIESTFSVQNSIKTTQTYYTLYENIAEEVSIASPRSWDLAFESAGDGSRVMLGWSSASTAHKTGKYIISDVSQNEVLDYISNSNKWTFDDPAYTNYPDSLSLENWEDGEVYIQSRGVESNNYYLIQFVDKTEDSYIFNYAKATDNQNITTVTIDRSEGLNYIYYSYDESEIVTVEPNREDWDLLFTPHLGWWETLTVGEYSPYTTSGILINNENGVKVAQIFDSSIEFDDIDETYIATSDFTDCPLNSQTYICSIYSPAYA